MFLTKKSLVKIWLMTLCYVLLGGISLGLWFFLGCGESGDAFLLIMGIALLLLSVLVYFWGRYAEGKGKLLALGNELVRKKCKPAEFLCRYEELRGSKELAVNRPELAVLQLVVIAHDILDQRQQALATAEEMIGAAKEKKKNLAMLFKVSLLFSYEQTEQAQALWESLQRQKLDPVAAYLADAIAKSDRAMAMGDYKTVEFFKWKQLEASFPKPDPLSKLVIHYKLGEVYEKLQEREKAREHYQYCADFGGETAMKTSAIEKLKALK